MVIKVNECKFETLYINFVASRQNQGYVGEHDSSGSERHSLSFPIGRWEETDWHSRLFSHFI